MKDGALLFELCRYQEWADAQLVEAVEACPAAAADGIPQTHLVQAVLHSQHHRGQVATRLRDLGGSPPTVDYIIWKRKHA